MWDRDTRKTFDVDYFNTHNNNTHKKYASSLYFGVYVYSIYGDDDVLYFYDEYILEKKRETYTHRIDLKRHFSSSLLTWNFEYNLNIKL